MAADGPAGHCRRPAAGARGGQDTLRVSYPPLDTPHIFPRTRRPSVARLKARCPQMCLVFQGFILDGSGAGAGKFRADKRPISETTHGTEPPYPRLAANASLSGSKEGLGESRGGKGTIRCPFPLLPLAVGTAFPVGGRRQSPAAGRRQVSQPSLWKKS